MAAERAPTILMTADTVGGVWTYVVELATALAWQGCQVHVATMGAPLRRHQRAQLAGVSSVTLHESAWRLEWMPQPWDDVERAGAWLLELEQRVQPDVIHLNQYAFGALPFRAPTLLVAHSCVLSWWQAVHGTEAPAEWDTYRTRVAAGLHAASLVAAPTLAMLRTLEPNYGVPPEGEVLPNGRDVRRFQPAAKQPFVFAAGRFWDEAKNLAALDAVAADLPWPVRVAGSCVHPAGRIWQPQHVQALGELPSHEVALHMACASIYALPARYEPFGLSVLEAALSGCALVLGDIPSLREVWGDTALFVPPTDTVALRAAITRLASDDAERQRRAAAARERALRYSRERMLAAVLGAYASLCPAFGAVREEVLACE